MQKQQEQRTFNEKIGDGTSMCYFLMSSHALGILMFLRSSWGLNAIGIYGIACMVMMLVYGGLTDSPEMFTFFFLWLFALVYRRIQSGRAFNRGVIEHSRYGGYPWLAMKFPGVKKLTTATLFIEPMLCIVLGTFVSAASQPLGTYIILGFFSLLFKAGFERTVLLRQVRSMRDGHIEQQRLAERFRGRIDDF